MKNPARILLFSLLAPDTEAPDTEAPDTEAPDTEAPDTEAPGAGAWMPAGPMALAPITLTLLALLLSCKGEEPMRAHVTQLRGTVQIESAGAVAAATTGRILAAKDAILTGPDSSADLTLPGGSVLRVQSDTRLSLEDLGKGTRMKIEKGGLLLGLSKQQANESFQVQTPTAVASVRGTSFAVSAERQSVAVLTGSVEIQKEGKSLVLESLKETRTDRAELKAQKVSKENARQLGEILDIAGAEKLDDFSEMQKNWATVGAAESGADFLPARRPELKPREAKEK